MVADYILLDSHAGPGVLGFGDGHRYAVTDLLSKDMMACALSPRAKVQFTGCILACGPAGGEIRAGIEQDLRDPSFTLQSGASPFGDVRILMNTDLGEVSSGARFFPWWLRILNIRSINDLAIEYRFNGQVVLGGGL